jgi:hypothetical protein
MKHFFFALSLFWNFRLLVDARNQLRAVLVVRSPVGSLLFFFQGLCQAYAKCTSSPGTAHNTTDFTKWALVISNRSCVPGSARRKKRSGSPGPDREPVRHCTATTCECNKSLIIFQAVSPLYQVT